MSDAPVQGYLTANPDSFAVVCVDYGCLRCGVFRKPIVVEQSLFFQCRAIAVRNRP